MKKIVMVSVTAALIACSSDNSVGGNGEIFPVDEFGNAVACVVELEGLNAEANGTIVTCSNGHWIPYVDPNQNNPGPENGNGNGQPENPNIGPNQPFYDDPQSSQSENPWNDNPVVSSSSDSPVPSNQFTDSDGHTYQTKVYGAQTWMIENLKRNTSESYCYDNNPSNCETYGRLYSWNAAQNACPPGWHLPSNVEWETLFQTVGAVHRYQDRWEDAASILKSRTGWDSGNGEDRVGFNIKPAGTYDPESGVSASMGWITGFWDTGYDESSEKGFLWKVGGDFHIERIDDHPYYGYSVRCVKD